MERLRVQHILDIVYRLRRGQSERAIVRDTGYARNTVRAYHRLAEKHGFLDLYKPLPEPEVMLSLLGPIPAPPQSASTLEPYRSVVEALVKQDVEMMAIYQRLVGDHCYSGSYSSVRRFVAHLRPKDTRIVLRIETEPGKEAQVDFGGVGKMAEPHGGVTRPAYCFVMTLSHSRHQYVEFVFNQKISTWIACHRHAFESFGGVPASIVIDNLKAAILVAELTDPVLSEPYMRMARHYGTLIHPCRVRTPEHKGKVESGVHYVQRNFIAGRTFLDIDEANRKAERWVMETAGMRDHGTIHEQPLMRFRQVEQAALLPLPAEPFDLLAVREVKAHPDCHVRIDQSYYSVPFETVGKKLEAHVYERVVQIYDGTRLLVTHQKATKAGQRITRNEHYPKEKLIYLERTPDFCRDRAGRIGASCSAVVETLLSERPLDHLRGVQNIIGLSERYDCDRVEAACARALHFGDPRYRRIRDILKAGLDSEPIGDQLAKTEPKSYAFARGSEEFFPEEVSEC